jgi:hypothetical protein
MTNLPPLHEYDGSCHCGAIGFRYLTAQPPAEWSIRACQCTFCRAHAALSTSDPAGSIEFRGLGSDALQRYQFGQHTADFLLCRECGVYLGALMETPGGMYGIVNVNALRPIPELPALAAPMDYGAESANERAGRREQRWAPALLLAG